MTENNTTLTNATFEYPDSALLYRKKTELCALCGFPIWAHVQVETDKYFLSCACGDTTVRSNFSKWKVHFVNAEQGDI